MTSTAIFDYDLIASVPHFHCHPKRILPWKTENGYLHFISDVVRSQRESQDLVALMSFLLNKKVELHAFSEVEGLTGAEFSKTLDDVYGYTLPDAFSAPVFTDIMNLLVIDNDVARAKSNQWKLENDGYKVFIVSTIEDAATFLKGSCVQMGVVIAPKDLKNKSSDSKVGKGRLTKVLSQFTQATIMHAEELVTDYCMIDCELDQEEELSPVRQTVPLL